ncbi:MAG: hypothetical protein KAR11_00800 [Phycisphaerae bacterium]|nr:hypothetical protein [Phycisphaerae bacterium]
MANIQMEIIPEPKQGTAAVLIPGENGPQVILKGKGKNTYICGCCRMPICENVQHGQLANLVFKCFGCGSFNRIRGT